MKGPWHRKKAVSHSAVMVSFPSFSARMGIEPTEESVKDLGLAIEPIVGLRSYYVDTDTTTHPVLLSYNGAPWPYREPLYAVCGNDVLNDHEVPSEECNCGIYAWRKELTENTTGKLYGEVYLWGDVLIGDHGYRAEAAYPKNLTIATKPTRAVMRIRDGLAEAYGVPVMIVEPPAEEEAEDPMALISSAGLITPAQYWSTTAPFTYYTYGPTGATGATHPGYSTPGYQMPPSPPKPHLGT